MTKIYEALESAGRERAQSGAEGAPVPASTGLPKGLEDKLLSLNRRIESLLDAQPVPVVVFAGAQPGEDSSKLVFEFARLAAIRLEKQVLLVAAGSFPYVGRFATGERARSWEDVVHDQTSIDDVIYPVEGTSMAVSQMCASDLSLPSVLASTQFGGILDALRQHFNLILIDAPPLGVSSSAVLLSSASDGVVLVVEAEKTRWQAIKHGMNQIAAQRGNVLGIILNKQRHYIPDFIYRKL